MLQNDGMFLATLNVIDWSISTSTGISIAQVSFNLASSFVQQSVIQINRLIISLDTCIMQITLGYLGSPA